MYLQIKRNIHKKLDESILMLNYEFLYPLNYSLIVILKLKIIYLFKNIIS